MLFLALILTEILAACACVYYLLGLFCVTQFFRQLRRSPSLTNSPLPPVSILKPVRGIDHEAYENFASFCRLDYPEYEVVFAASDENDEVIPVIEKLKADFQATSIRLIHGVPRHGANDKINNFCQLAKDAKYDLLVMSDSDVRVEPDYLKVVVAAFSNPKVGVVTALYRSLSAGTLASRLSALAMYTDSAPGALVARKLEKNMRFAFGWTMATHKQRLAEIGGWESLANYHSDDFELGKRIAERGYQVELMAKPVSMVLPPETLREYFRHEFRWSVGLKSVRPLGYCGLLFTHGLPWALLGFALATFMGHIPLAFGFLFSYLSLRLSQTWATGAWGLQDRNAAKLLWLVPLRDAFSFAVWLAGFFSNVIIWRGLFYRVKEGRLFPQALNSAKPKVLVNEELLTTLAARPQEDPGVRTYTV